LLEKQKNKIKKLLELSLSDNEHEAGIALKQAMSLMNKHNISKDDVYGQSMVSEIIITPYYRIPDWYVKLNSYMSKLSGCFSVYQNGNSYSVERANIQIVGRQRDVENSIYLIEFLSREIEKSVKSYKTLHLKDKQGYVDVAALVRSYRLGFINKIYKKMNECQHKFFAENKTLAGEGNELMCVDSEARRDDAKTYYVEELGLSYSSFTSSSRYHQSAMQDGSLAADDININPAVHQQDKIKHLQYSS
jgi:hypothetical protein